MLSAVMKRVSIVAVVMALGCAPVKTMTRSMSDSVVVRETVRDTVIELSPDSSLVRALIECDSLGRARLSELLYYRAGDRISPPVITMVDNILTAKAQVDSFKIYARLKDRYEEHRTSETVVETVEVNKLTTWQKVRLRLGEAMMVAVALWIVRSVKKVRNTLF